MDECWEKFIKEQKDLAKKAEILAKKNKAKDKEKEKVAVVAAAPTEAVTVEGEVPVAPIIVKTAIFKLYQIQSITQKYKNDKMDQYYTMREQDRALQKYNNFEENEGIEEEKADGFREQKQSCILNILQLLKDLGLPSKDLQAYVNENNITLELPTDRTEETKTSPPLSKKVSLKKEPKVPSVSLHLLHETEIAALTQYGFYRPEEEKLIKTAVPTWSELCLIAHKAFLDAEQEAKDEAKAKALRRKLVKKKTIVSSAGKEKKKAE